MKTEIDDLMDAYALLCMWFSLLCNIAFVIIISR